MLGVKALGNRCLRLAGCLLLSAAACARQNPETRPDTSRVTVGVTTTGPGARDLTFRVTIDPAGITAPVKADAGVFTTSALPAGDLVVRLQDVPARCRVENGAERKVSTTRGRTAVVRFLVLCS